MSELPITKIKPNLWNPNRMPEEIYKALVEDIKANGTKAIDPIHVRPLGKDFFEVIDGEHRLKAVVEAGFHEISCLIDEVSEEEAKAINYRKNKERGNMDPFREAELFKSETDAGKTYDDVAEKYGTSHARVGAKLSLLGIFEPAKEIVRRRTDVSPGHLEVVATLKKPKQQAELAKRIVDKDLSVRATKAEAEKITAKPKPPEIAPEPVPTKEEWVCPICGARYTPWHISDQDHKFVRVKETENANG